MGLLGFFRQKKALSEKKQEEVQKQQITKLKKNIYQQRIDFLKDKLEHLKQRHEELILEDQIADLEEDLEGNDEIEENPQTNINDFANPDAMFNNLISLGAQALANRKNSAPVVNAPPTSSKRTYSDEEISAIISKTPKETLLKLKDLNETILANVIRQQYPDADDISISKTIPLIKNQ